MNKGVRWWWYAAVTAAVVAVGGLLWWWRRVGDDGDGRRLAARVVAVVLAAAGVAVEGDGDVNGGVKGMTMMSGGRVWGRWGDEAAEEPLWPAFGWPEVGRSGWRRRIPVMAAGTLMGGGGEMRVISVCCIYKK
ncbi:hypothetical protein Tco_0353378 [Tanacetum coccineum]